MFDITEELKKLPQKPGVYLMRDADDTIIYVGKAKNLRNRVRSYFRNQKADRGLKIEKMITLIVRFEVIMTDSELEALVLENNLIKEHRPRYNTLLTDDKTYPYIKVTLGEDYPRVLFSREMKKDRSRYFGPYAGGFSVKETIELINKLYMLRNCNRMLPQEIGRGRACLNFHIKQCSGPCQGHVSKDEYAAQVKGALAFLGGEHKEILNELKKKMTEASENLDFEEAIRFRDLINNVESICVRQKISDATGEDKDIIGLAVDELDAVAQVFFVRDGKLIGREHYYLANTYGVAASEIALDFVKQFYAGTPFVPRELVLPEKISDIATVEEWLSKKRGSRVYITVPKIGDKEKLVELAAKNARLILSGDKERLRREEERTGQALSEISALLGLEKISRIEAYDISNTSGFANVGSMVVYENGKPKKSDYRKFRVKSVSGPNDYACMKEVLTRRLTHSAAQSTDNGDSFAALPDLLLIDGGKGQVGIVQAALDELGISLPVAGMVKDDRHRTRALYFADREHQLEKNSEGFKLITQIQDEAHRFAIEYHRSLRSKEAVKSVLNGIPGVGPVRRKALMRHFSTIKEIERASVETLAELPEIPRNIAEMIYGFFHDSE